MFIVIRDCQISEFSITIIPKYCWLKLCVDSMKAKLVFVYPFWILFTTVVEKVHSMFLWQKLKKKCVKVTCKVVLWIYYFLFFVEQIKYLFFSPKDNFLTSMNSTVLFLTEYSILI